MKIRKRKLRVYSSLRHHYKMHFWLKSELRDLDHLASVGQELLFDSLSAAGEIPLTRADAEMLVDLDDNPRPVRPGLARALDRRIIAHATLVFGSIDDAKRWLKTPAIGLNQQRPVDLLKTVQGRGMVIEFLRRIEYGIYC